MSAAPRHSGRILHLLSQRPELTGSGVTLDAYVRCAAKSGWEQQVIFGLPADAPLPAVGGLPAEGLRPLRFGVDPLDFPLPGMSDIMPYASSVFSRMTTSQLSSYRDAWRSHVSAAIAAYEPELIHSHHVWLLSSLLGEIAPGIPHVISCHATGLRQMRLCPDLAAEVCRGCAGADALIVMTEKMAATLAEELSVARENIHVLPNGYRDELFHLGSSSDPGSGSGPESKVRGASDFMSSPRLVYVGKYSEAKGLPSLLDACERLRAEHSGLRLEIAGGGAGEEADRIRRRMDAMGAFVTQHGLLGQPELAELLRACDIAVLPSFYEGVPLVLVEARACGCRLVASDLPGIRSELAPVLGDDLGLVPLPRMAGIDRPAPEALPGFVDDLHAALRLAIVAGPPGPPGPTSLTSPTRPTSIEHGDTLARRLGRFAWSSIFTDLERIWLELLS